MPFTPPSTIAPHDPIGQPCSPRHKWAIPRRGDKMLRCGFCGRMLPFEGMSDYVANNIIRAQLKHNPRGQEFIAGWREAHTAA